MDASERFPRRELLHSLYRYQVQVEASREVACGPGCAACCTDRVYLTGLEGDLLRRELARQGRSELLARLEPGLKPAYTCNQLARLCIEGREPPEEAASDETGACALLEHGRCGVYEARPLACRVMASRVTCRAGDQAQGDPWWFTLDTALMQIAEHIDLGGVYGALGTVLRREELGQGEGLLRCEPLPGLVAPPEHQARLSQALGPLFATVVAGRPLGRWLDLMRAASGAKV